MPDFTAGALQTFQGPIYADSEDGGDLLDGVSLNFLQQKKPHDSSWADPVRAEGCAERRQALSFADLRSAPGGKGSRLRQDFASVSGSLFSSVLILNSGFR